MTEPEQYYVRYNLFNVKTKANCITANMTYDDFERTINEEKPDSPYMLICEDGTDIFYINSPVGCYRITLVDD